jgi:hypothetical protein
MGSANGKPIGENDENTRCDLVGDCRGAGGAVAGVHLSVGGLDIFNHPGSLIVARSQAVRSSRVWEHARLSWVLSDVSLALSSERREGKKACRCL